MTDAAGAGARRPRNRSGRPIERSAGATRRGDAHASWRIACFTSPTVRALLATALALALAAPAAAHAGRQLTRAELAQVRVIKARVDAERQAKADRRRQAADKKKRVRAAKMAAALQMAADYKADKAKKQAEREQARKAEEIRRQHLLLELLRLRGFQRGGR